MNPANKSGVGFKYLQMVSVARSTKKFQGGIFAEERRQGSRSAESGEKRIEWARRHMPVLEKIKQEFERDKPLKGARIVACLHVTVETANLITTLVAGGAEVQSRLQSTLHSGRMAAALAARGLYVYASGARTIKKYTTASRRLWSSNQCQFDDGPTHRIIHKEHLSCFQMFGGCERHHRSLAPAGHAEIKRCSIR